MTPLVYDRTGIQQALLCDEATATRVFRALADVELPGKQMRVSVRALAWFVEIGGVKGLRIDDEAEDGRAVRSQAADADLRRAAAILGVRRNPRRSRSRPGGEAHPGGPAPTLSVAE